MRLHKFLSLVVTCLCLGLFCRLSLLAQEQELSEAAQVVEVSAAWVRVWLMSEGPASQVDIVGESLKASNEPIELLSGAPPWFYTGYRDVEPGNMSIRVLRRDAARSQVASVAHRFRKRHYYTVLFTTHGQSSTIEVIEDTVDEKLKEKPTETTGEESESENERDPLNERTKAVVPRKIAVYHFLPNVNIEVAAPAVPFSKTLTFSERAVFNEPAADDIVLFIKPFFPDVVLEPAEIDFSMTESPSVSLLLIQDVYGRFSPRLVTNASLD